MAVVGDLGGGQERLEINMAIYKNKTSQKVAVFAYDSTDGSAKTGDAANITAQISLDGGTTVATNDVNPTELDATDAPGIYIFDMTQAETNANMIILAAASSTTNILLDPLIIYTEPEQRVVDVTAISGDSVAADNAESFFDGTGYAGTNNVIPTVTTLTGHTPQTGDSYSYLGTNLGALGDNLSAIPWNSAWDAEVQSECNDALTAWGKTGFSLSSTGLDLIVPSIVTGPPTLGTTSIVGLVGWVANKLTNKGTFNKTTGVETVYDNAGSGVATRTCTDDGTTFTAPNFA